MRGQVAGADSLLRAKMDSLQNVVKVNPNKDAVSPSVDTILKGGSNRWDTLLVAESEIPQMLSASQHVDKADALLREYKFKEAIREYERAMTASADSLEKVSIEDKLIACQNGQVMMEYASQPIVVSKQKFSVKDFFLFYPLKDRSWRPVPNQLDSLSASGFASAMYIPDGSDTIYYSAKDEDGISNLYTTRNLGDMWSTPILINEGLTSSSDEIFPMVSPDGKTLYFASKGLYGMGGYDLYKSKWNSETKDWDTPENLGFPYSSPYDDFLYINTEDGKYSIFASNRECSKDSVYLYVLEYDSMPVRKNITSEEDIRQLSYLNPVVDPSRIDNDSVVSDKMPENDDTKRYIAKMTQVRELREAIYNFGKELDDDRLKISSLEGDAKAELMNDILQRELQIPVMNDSLSRAVKELQSIEMDFLVNGFVIDPDKVQAEANREIVGAATGYTFSKNSMGPALKMVIQAPVVEFDYSFMILPEGRFAEDNTLPSGLIYQIQLFTTGNKATVKDLNGLSPVFEKYYPTTGKRTYSVGLFRSYQDALSNINKVKRAGFKTAIIVAFDSGKSISVAEARNLEEQVREICSVKIYPESGNLSDEAKATIREHTDKDLARSVEDGAVVFIVGPFGERALAEELVSALKEVGETNVRIEVSEK